jgi:hypothetical protein
MEKVEPEEKAGRFTVAGVFEEYVFVWRPMHNHGLNLAHRKGASMCAFPGKHNVLVARLSVGLFFLACLMLSSGVAYSVPGAPAPGSPACYKCNCRGSVDEFFLPDGKGGGTDYGNFRTGQDPPADYTQSAMMNLTTGVAICNTTATGTVPDPGGSTYDEWKITGDNYNCGPPAPSILVSAEVINFTKGQVKTKSAVTVRVCR